MSDIQILTICVSIIIPVAMLLYSNSRVGEVSKRIDDAKGELNRRIDDMKADLIKHLDNGFEHMEMLLKLHVAEHHHKD